MTDTRDRAAASGVGMTRAAHAVVASFAALIAIGGVAVAGEMKFPKDDPKVALDVPDNWTIDTTATGIELHSPEKNSIVVAQVVTRKRALVEAWTKEAAAKLKAFGVSFDKNTSVPPTPAAAAPAPAVPTGAPAKRTEAFTFSGAPSLETPGTVGSNKKADPGQFSVEALTGFDGKIKKMPKLHFKTVEYFGTTMNGKPVDAELAIYTLSDDRVFLLMQESEPTDNRSVEIAQSVRGTKDSRK